MPPACPPPPKWPPPPPWPPLPPRRPKASVVRHSAPTRTLATTTRAFLAIMISLLKLRVCTRRVVHLNLCLCLELQPDCRALHGLAPMPTANRFLPTRPAHVSGLGLDAQFPLPS